MSIVIAGLEELSQVGPKAGPDGLTGVRKFKVPWASRTDFIRLMKGSTVNVGGIATYGPPSYWPGLPTLQVDTVDWEEWPNDNIGSGNSTTITDPSVDSIAFNYAIGVANYKSTQPDNKDDGSKGDGNRPKVPFGRIQEDYVSTAEFLTSPGRNWRWASDSKQLPPDLNPGIRIPTVEITLTWMRMPYIKWDVFNALVGTVNSGVFMHIFPIQTVLYLGATVSEEVQENQDNPTWKAVMKFKARVLLDETNANANVTWNMLFRPGAATRWQVIESVGAGNKKIYAATDFSTLFTA